MMPDVDLSDLVRDFADALRAADALRPQARSIRSGNLFRPGIGPHGEDRAVALILEQMKARNPEVYGGAGQVVYPGSRQRCDLGVGLPLRWAIEVKMARARGDNGKRDDTYLKDLLSPYPDDRSAVGDAVKLAQSGFTARKGVLIYGFDFSDRRLDPAIEAAEILMRSKVALGPRVEAPFSGLVHPVHSEGRVFAWEVITPTK